MSNLADLQSTAFVKWLNKKPRSLAARYFRESLSVGDGGIAWDIMKELSVTRVTEANVNWVIDKLREEQQGGAYETGGTFEIAT